MAEAHLGMLGIPPQAWLWHTPAHKHGISNAPKSNGMPFTW